MPRVIEGPQHEGGNPSNRHYPYPPTNQLFVSVTTVTGGTEDLSFVLGPWKARLAAQVTLDNAEHIGALMAAAPLGPVIAKDAKYGAWPGKVAAVKFVTAKVEELADIKSEAGKYVHAVTEALVLWAHSPEGTGADVVIPGLPDHLVGAMYDDEPIEVVVDAMVTGFINFVIDYAPRFTASEMTVFNPAFKYAGTLDGRLELVGVDVDADGNLFPSPGHVLTVTLDTKSGRHEKWSWKEQLVAYQLAPEGLAPQGEIVDLTPTKACAVLHLRPAYRRGYRLRFVSDNDRREAWNSFRHALHTFTARDTGSKKVGPIARPLGPDGQLAPMYLADLDGTVHGSALNPLLRELGDDATVDDVARFEEKDLLAIKGIGKARLETIAEMVAAYATPAPTEKAVA